MASWNTCWGSSADRVSWTELASQGLGRKNVILKTENGFLEYFLWAPPRIRFWTMDDVYGPSMMVMDHGWWLWTMDDDDGPWMMIMDRGWWLWTMDDGYGDSGSCIHDVWYIQWATLIMSVTMFLSFSQRCTMVCRKARGWSYKPYELSLFNFYMCTTTWLWLTFL